MHCYICDFSESVTSDTYGVLEGVDSVGNRVLEDERHNVYICVDCLGSSLANYRSLVNTTPSLAPGELEHVVELEDISGETYYAYSSDTKGLESGTNPTGLTEDQWEDIW